MRYSFYRQWLFLWLNIVFGMYANNVLTVDMLQHLPHPLVPVLVIGSGPAGLATAFQAVQSKIYTVVVTGKEPGGQLIGSVQVSNILGIAPADGNDVMENIEQQAAGAGVHFLDDEIVRLEMEKEGRYFLAHTEQGEILCALCVVIATGSVPVTLNVPGEQIYENRGFFVCAKCDSHKIIGKDVVVVGGGDSAVNAAMILAPHAKSITVLVRKGHMRATAVMQERLSRYVHVKVLLNRKVVEILGDNTWVKAVQIEDSIRGDRELLPCEGVFVAIGHTPNSLPFSTLVTCDQFRYIKTEGRSQKTSCAGIFAAGEVADAKYRLVSVALGDGTKAGCDVVEYLHGLGFSDQVSRQLEPVYFKKVR